MASNGLSQSLLIWRHDMSGAPRFPSRGTGYERVPSLSDMTLEELKDQFLDETEPDPQTGEQDIDYWYVDKILKHAVDKGILEVHIERGEN